jgi:membrane fusion protein, multidrug efflux system
MIDQAAATLASAEADLEREQQDYKRYSELMTSDFASRQRFKQAQADAGNAKGGRQKRRSLAGEQNQLDVLRSQRREEQARLQQDRANLQLAQNDLDNTVIRAHVSWTAGNRASKVGQYIKAGHQSRDPTTVASAAAAFHGNPADPHAAGGVGRCLS